MKIQVSQACRFIKPEVAFELKHQKPTIFEDASDELLENKFFQSLVKVGKIKVFDAPKVESKKDESDFVPEMAPKAKGKSKKDE